MAPTEAADTFVIYGVGSLPSVALPGSPGSSSGQAFHCLKQPLPILVIAAATGEPLRFNNAPPDLLPEAPNPNVTDPFEMIRQRMMPLCDPWHMAAQGFVVNYLSAVEAMVRNAAPEIERERIACPGLFEPRDWVYSAPCPLPRAHLATAEPFFDAVDFAFWSGESLVAVDIAPPSLLPKAARARRDRLSDSGVHYLVGAPGEGDRGWAEFIKNLLPRGTASFWEGELIPVGPFPGRSLDALDDMT